MHFHIKALHFPIKVLHFRVISRFSSNLPASFPSNSPLCGSSLYKMQENLESSKGKFTICEKPLPLSGKVHLGHAYNRIIKDLILRKKLVSGYNVEYLPGFATFAEELEKNAISELLARNLQKSLIKQHSAQEIREVCREKARKSLNSAIKSLKSLNLLADFSKSWLTSSQKYVDSCLEIFEELLEKKLVFYGLSQKFVSFSQRREVFPREIEPIPCETSGFLVKFPLKTAKSDRFLAETHKKLSFLCAFSEEWPIISANSLGILADTSYFLLRNAKTLEEILVSKHFFEENQRKFLRKGFSAYLEFGGAALLNKKLEFEHPILAKKRVKLVEYREKPEKTQENTGVFPVIPAHVLEDFELFFEKSQENRDFVDLSGRFRKKTEDFPEFLENCEVLASETALRLRAFLKKNGKVFEDFKVSLKETRYFHKETQERVVPILRNCLQMRNLARKTEVLPDFREDSEQEIVETAVFSQKNLEISKKNGVWGVPVPVFLENERAFLEKEVVSHIRKLFFEHGCDIWYSWGTERLLPEKYAEKACKLEKSQEIFAVSWIDASACVIKLQECVGKQQKFLREKAKETVNLLVEGRENLNNWIPNAYIIGCKQFYCNFINFSGFSLK